MDVDEKYRSIMLPVVWAAIASLPVVAVWFAISDRNPVQYSSASFLNSYESIEALAVASDLAVPGTVNGIVAREIDRGTRDPVEIAEGGGVPAVFYEVAVTETLQGDSADTIIVAGTDPGKTRMSLQETPLRRGQQVLLFLEELTSETAPGITVFNHFYIALNMDNGVFDLKDANTVAPRKPKVLGV